MSAAAPRHTNRLALETSPYLLQHQHNPVDWYAWGPEAFERARVESKPIFLSVGYSTCYWCHVMERECFEVEAIAAVMNRHFICIKVDREERPDVDQLYMTAVQVMTGQGGWPMSVWLTPDRRPFHGGTYFPPRDAHGRPGFPRLLEGLSDAWRNRRDEVSRSADELGRILGEVAAPRAKASRPLDAAAIETLVRRSLADYEPRFGGFGSAPKFPRQTLLRLLLTWMDGRPANDVERQRVGKMLRHTLDAMADGGIRDHLSGGFHRYSTDARWLVPHFEVMLYDQAMLAGVYARASRILGERRYARVARGICDFVLREMTGPHGEFHTALDAEVDHREGLNYLWTPDEIEAVLGETDANVFNAVYGLAQGPNFADPHHGDGTPDKNILYLPRGSANEASPDLVEMRLKLREARAKRKQPLLDTKVITSWNAMMIEALAVAARELGERSYAEAGARCADFLMNRHFDPAACKLYRASREGKVKHDGFLDDYAFLALAILELCATTRDIRWRRHADVLSSAMLRFFGDDGGDGAFYFTGVDAADLIIRQKTAADSPLPSGNACAAIAMYALGDFAAAQRIVDAFGEQLWTHGESMSSLLEAALLIDRERSCGVALPDRDAVPRVTMSHPLVDLTAHRVGDRRIEVNAVIDPRYHIYDTSTDPRLGLHATRLRIDPRYAGLVDFIDYPPAKMLDLPYGPPVAAYEGNVQMCITFTDPLPSDEIELSLTFQACDQTACLRPSVITTRA